MELIDTVNTRHTKGVDFGTGHNLFPAEIHTIAAIGINEGISITQLAEQLNVSKPTISDRVCKLVGKGLVVKEKQVEDAKAVALGLTVRGQIAFAGHEAHHLEMYERFREYLGSETQSKIESISQTLTQFLSIARNLDNKGH